MNDLFAIYRVFSRQKVGSLRLMLYVILGFAFSAKCKPAIFALDALFVLGGVLFAGALNDYYDHRKLGENNYFKNFLKKSQYSKIKLFMLIVTPLILPIGLFYPLILFGASKISLIMLIVSFILCIIYCMPPLRLKQRKFIGIFPPPVGIYLLFLQAVFLNGTPSATSLLLSAVIFLLSWYLDFIHLANDSVSENEVVKISAESAMLLAKSTIIISLIFLFSAALYCKIAIVGIIFWTIRLYVLQKIKPGDLSTSRRNILSRIYCIEEFAIYALFSIYFHLG